MRPCPSCERLNADDARACAGCGTQLPVATPDAFSETVRSSRGPGATGSGALAAAAPAPEPEHPVPELAAALDGRYQILGLVGEGGMGKVYEARHLKIGKRVAIKVLVEKYAQKADVVARFLQEARLASSIGHEHIVDINDFGETADGRTYVVMEYLEGESLHDVLLRENILPPSRALPIVRQVASALGAAHDKGIVHRDIKPENVFICRRGDRDFVKVLDFGISKAVRIDEGIEASPRLTTTGMVLGTPLYLSPEQARGEEDLDRRIDVYALGVVLYETLTGEMPFHGGNYLSIISQILEKEARPPSELRSDLGLSKDVDLVVARAMHKDRALRYQTMAELDADLARLEEGLAPRARTTLPVPLPRRRWPVVAGWLAGLAALAAAVASIIPRLLAEPEPQPAAVARTVPMPVIVAPPAVPPAAPSTIHATVTSVPPGAEVLWGSVRKGETPVTLEWPRGQEAIELTLRREGYEDATAPFYPTADQSVDVKLTARPFTRGPARKGPRPAAGTPTPPDRGPTSGGEIKGNPYKK